MGVAPAPEQGLGGHWLGRAPGTVPSVAGMTGDPRAGSGALRTSTCPGRMPTNRCLLSFWPVDFLRNFFSQTLGLGTQKERLLDELTLEGVARYMQSERCKCPAPRWATSLIPDLK